MIKKLFGQLFKLVLYPARAWSMLAREKEDMQEDVSQGIAEKEFHNNDAFFRSYFYPVLGITALLTFIGIFLNKKEFDIQLALRSTISVTLTVFVGFYLASFVLSEVLVKWFGRAKPYQVCERFVGYASTLVYLMYMLLAVFPELFFLKLGLFYTVYIVWEGAGSFMKIPESKRLRFTVIASAVILVAPALIEKIMFMTMPGMRT